jgi:hypothetical protein
LILSLVPDNGALVNISSSEGSRMKAWTTKGNNPNKCTLFSITQSTFFQTYSNLVHTIGLKIDPTFITGTLFGLLLLNSSGKEVFPRDYIWGSQKVRFFWNRS